VENKDNKREIKFYLTRDQSFEASIGKYVNTRTLRDQFDLWPTLLWRLSFETNSLHHFFMSASSIRLNPGW
jgi:hypothetical protein